MKEIELTVQDVLKRPLFNCAKIIAGKKGINRKIKWSHILEVKDIDMFVNGGELILTTGMNIQFDAQNQLDYVKKLIDLNTACLCIEMETSVKSLSEDVLSLAENYDYPIIIFEQTVKFVEITQDLHTFIINRHHQMITDLDLLSTKFNQKSLQPNGILKILQELYHYFQQPAFFFGNTLEKYYFPSDQKHTECSIRIFIEENEETLFNKRFVFIRQQTFVVVPVRVFEQIWGYIFLEAFDLSANEFYTLVLDRAAIAISQILLRFRTIEERKQNLEDDLVRALLLERTLEYEQFSSIFPIQYLEAPYRVMCLGLKEKPIDSSPSHWEEKKIQMSMLLRSLLNKAGFYSLLSVRPHEIIAIVFIPPSIQLHIERDKWNPFLHALLNVNPGYFPSAFLGISSLYFQVSSINKGYEEATYVLSLKNRNISPTHFFDEIGIYRLLLPLSKTDGLKDYINYYLGKIIEYDKQNDSELLKTLAVYLECNGSKKEAAERLFIVRQTLYHRIEKLELLLGTEFLNPVNRLALEVAIHGYYLEESNKVIGQLI
ncbi:PucR family transcriptional regulator [Niallia sp. NCCP-28]|uniref:PucR family transcriptional regulator n=1 Tax=Niallia sp. NCCP-28 TaxID=2934712 RepID=UPI002084AF47|nr:PucR family transcriptional regulator [Niallia sp. NCCP-28]GKU83492.1 PucR family transcriptional regulator [Niallia sp. NCCP-28]